MLCIENLNRGGKIYRKLEKIYCYFFYERAIKKDISIGISQIKISNITNILRQSPIMFKKNLFKPSFSINVMTLIIKKILKNTMIVLTILMEIFSHILLQIIMVIMKL